MTLRARLTLWSMLAMASIVTVVSLTDLVQQFNRQFEYFLERSRLVAGLTPLMLSETINSHPASDPNAVLRSPEVGKLLFRMTLVSRTVDAIVVTDLDGNVVAESFVPDQAFAGNTAHAATSPQKYTPRPDFAAFVRSAHWWRKYWVMNRASEAYELTQDTFDPRTQQRIATVHVLVLPRVIRNWTAPIMSDHAWVAIFFVAFAVLVAFVFSTIAFHPLSELGKMVDQIAGGSDLQQIANTNTDEFGIVASKVSLLGRQLKGAQTEFSDLKGNFERLLAEMNDAVLIFGRDRRLIAATGGIEAYLARPRVELVGRTVNEIFPPATSIGLLLSQAVQIGRPIQNRASPITVSKNGTDALRIALVSVEFLSAQSGMLIRLRDPEATQQIGRQLQIADRLSAISCLTSGVAHEVKNPLNAILMHVELAKLKLSHGDYDVNPQMEILSNEILRLDRVVKTFLDFTRPVQLNLTDVDLSNFIQELADLARPQAEASGISVEVTGPSQPVTISIDPDLFKQAALNVVVNAIEAMAEGGTLAFWAAVRDGQAEIRISDTGPGIPLDLREKIYNLYFTTKEKGSGIGLSMTFRIIQLHDGTIDFQSEEGRGTTFTLRIPLSTGAVIPAAE